MIKFRFCFLFKIVKNRCEFIRIRVVVYNRILF
nr:MAG TPA: hypothetical protein [Bacteriophage sp.]DAQ90505.1 MAG TPA: hypothetical protein [Caudoviricetes sp.]